MQQVMEQVLELLLVEDNPGDVRLIRESLKQISGLRLNVRAVEDLRAALASLEATEVDVVLLDLGLPDSRGAETFTAAHDQAPDVPIIVLTGMGDEELAVQMVQRGAQDYLVKGEVGGRELVRSIRYAIERQRADIARRMSHQRYQTLIENATYGICQVDSELRITLANRSLATILGYAEAGELLGQALSQWYTHRTDLIRLLASRATETALVGEEIRWTRHDGREIVVRLSAHPATSDSEHPEHWDLVIEDVTRQHELEAQLVHAQKMESIGRLAGGVAHDFNNLLTVILGECEDALSLPESARSDGPALTAIQEAAARAALLTRQLLTFSRQTVVEPVHFSLAALVEETGGMLTRLIGERVHLRSHGTGGACPVHADRGQITQVLMNFAVNARDAMPQGGTLTIVTSTLEIGEHDSPWPHVPPGRYAVLTTADTGLGMTAEVQERLFEPFFTTKSAGEGTGLGLAVSYGIARQAGGFIDVESAPGEGTTMRLILPCVVPPAHEGALGTTAHALSELPRGRESILFVEDDPDVARVVMRSLEGLGYHVLRADRVDLALRILATDEGSIDLLITDVVLPDQTGFDLSALAREMRPHLRVLFISGYTPDAVREHERELGPIELLSKPFTRAELAEKVRDLLDRH